MKRKLLLFFITAFTSPLFAQNFQDNKITFSYTQLPLKPIDKQYSTYEFVIIRGFEKSNEDSLMNYQIRMDAALQQYDSEMSIWREQVKNVDRQHLAAMAAWEKQQNAGTITPAPVKPPYPPQPIMPNVEEPMLHDDITDDQVHQSVDLEGYTRGAGGAVITLTFQPLSSLNIVEKKSGEGTSTKYNYSAQYQMPVELKVESPSQGIVYNTILLNEVRTYNMKDYSSKYDYQLWLMDNKAQFWKDIQNYAREQALRSVDNVLNDQCGFPVKTWSTEIFSVKKFKDHNYNDLTDAYTIASQGYDLIIQKRDRSAAKAKLTQAINMWNKALQESNLNDNKARINDEVTAMCYYNIAEAYFWMSDFNQAEIYINKAINGGKFKFKNAAKRLQDDLDNVKQRWNANY